MNQIQDLHKQAMDFAEMAQVAKIKGDSILALQLSRQAFLAYYWEHKEEIDADMQRRYEYAERLCLEAGECPLARRLRAEGLIK